MPISPLTELDGDYPDYLFDPTAVGVHRTAEAAFQSWAGTIVGFDHATFDATRTRDPDRFRVRRVGPFEYVEAVTPRDRALSPELREVVAAASDLPLFVEGSQSPLSVKRPCGSSDVDLLIVIDSSGQLPSARATLDRLRRLSGRVGLPVTPGIVPRSWLRLPGFYSAVELGPRTPDESWWHSSADACLAEAIRRVRAGLTLLECPDDVRLILLDSLAMVRSDDFDPRHVSEWRLTPRWVGLDHE